MKRSIKEFLGRFLLRELLGGMALTGRFAFEKKTTVQYPEERIPQSPRFRGLHALRRYPDGSERCVACKLCEAACPAMAITIESASDEAGNRRTTRYDLDLSKCIFCGFCAEACPVEAIVETRFYEYAVENRSDLVWNKARLLENGERFEADIAKDLEMDGKYR